MMRISSNDSTQSQHSSRDARRFGPVLGLTLGAFALAACQLPTDFDLRKGGFSTAEAAQNAAKNRAAPDANGVITYPNYQVVVARRNDTIPAIAQRLGLNPGELSRYNGIAAGTVLREGEIIALPTRVASNAPATIGGSGGSSGETIDITSLAGSAIDRAQGTSTPAATSSSGTEPLRHQVSRGETAYTIARNYGVSVRTLADWNGLGSDLTVREGQHLLIPVGSEPVKTASASPIISAQPAQPAPGEGSPTPTPPSASKPLPTEATTPAATPVPTPASPQLAQTQTAARLSLPVSGAIIRDFDNAKSKFILIAATPGTAVKAAADGTVKLISKNADGIQILVVDHGDGLQTAYSFVEGITVTKGTAVKRGQTMAKVAKNEFNALQFMVFKGTSSVDPNPYLN